MIKPANPQLLTIPPIRPDGAYKLDGIAAGEFWYLSGLCRFEPAELDPYVPAIRRLPTDAPLLS